MLFQKRKYQISKEKKNELIKELKKLSDKDFPEIQNRMEESRINDSDEDGALLGVISVEKESIERRIKEICEILENHEIIKDKDYCEPRKIMIGSTIRVKDKEKILDVKLVSSVEADPIKNHISEDSPLGKKLLKAKVGDTVVVKVRGNKIRYTILDVC
jgi:transcription elongation factor GreA